jgi:glutathione S-transferase
MKLYFHPLSSYSQKALTALYEKNVSFTPEIIEMMNPAARAEYKKVYPLGKVPLLVTDEGKQVPESTILIEYLEDHFPSSGTRLLPADKEQAREARYHDRVFDLYFMDPMTTLFFDARKPAGERSPAAVASAKATLDTVFARYDDLMAKRTWAAGDAFTMADCGAAPALGYLRMVYPFEAHKHLVAYANRLAERPSYKRVFTEAQPYFAKFMA